MRNISYFCIVKRIIRFFYTTFVALLLLFNYEAQASPLPDMSLPEISDSALASVEISLLTCKPHEEVYSLYGHTAIRIVDTEGGRDMVVNWGVFDSRKPNFVYHFIMGETDYMMAMVSTEGFLREYYYYGSEVIQQKLNMTQQEKRNFLAILDEYSKPENRIYRYNFYYDNCTTRARDVIVKAMEGKVEYLSWKNKQENETFRDLIHSKNADYPWCQWGNDFLLGVGSDAKMTHAERQFIPEMLEADFDSAIVILPNGAEKPLVESTSILLPAGQSMAEPMAGFPLSPEACSVLFLNLVIVFTMCERFLIRKELKWFDYIVFNLLGLLGLLLVVMMFSEHPTVKLNFQIFLFCPLWLVLYSPFVTLRRKRMIALVIIEIFLLGNFFQSYAEGLNILALSLLIRIVKNPKK